MRAVVLLPLVLAATLAHAAAPASVRMLDADGELVSVRAAAQDLFAVWEDGTLIVQVDDSDVLEWTPVNQLPDLFHAGVTLPGFLVGIPGQEVFVGFEGLDRWDLVGDGDPAGYETEHLSGDDGDITRFIVEIDGVSQGAVVDLQTGASFWQMGLEEADPRVFR